jgi:tripartite-type tricarboxylate transporter receptor subunit TctC
MVNDKHLYKNMPYEPSRDITPITIAVTQPSLLVVRSGLPAKNLAELIAELRKEPGKFNYASIGNGSLSHLAMALIALKSGTEIVHVPYGGSSQAVLALVSAEADMACLPALSVLSQVKSGKVRILGASTATRSTLLPDIPTLAEQGLSGIDAAAWIGVIAPAKTPMALRDRIQREISTVLKDPVVVQALHVQMMEVVGGSPEAFTTFMREEDARWAPVIEKNKITLD